MRVLLAVSTLIISNAAVGSVITVTSEDGRLSLGVDNQTGDVVSLQGMAVRSSTVFDNCGVGKLQSVQKNNSAIEVKKTFTCNGGSVVTSDVFGKVDSAKSNEVAWATSVEGTSDDDWSTPLATSLQFMSTDDMLLWLPWNKNTADWSTDPLQPEPFTNNSYTLGHNIISEHATFLFNNSFGISLISNPANYPHHGKVVTTSDGKILYQRDNVLFRPGVVHVFNMHLSLHGASFRLGLLQSLSKYRQFWSPYNSREQVLTYDGLGSYTSSNTIPQNASFLRDIGYKVNWDLGGRFFPYMGMYLPPVAPGEEWENDAEGTQMHINVTFDFIDQQYLAQKEEVGASPLSYFNIFEYGLNVVYNKSQTTPTGRGDWKNSSDYLSGYLIDSMITNFSCYLGCSSAGKNTAQYSWQNAVVMDPTTKSYNNFLMEQATSKLQNLKQFTGIAIDRSDWCQVYNHNNPGISFVNGSPATNFAGSWVEVTGQLRDILKNDTVILMNTVGFARLSLLRYFDGTFSEGSNVDSVGILGINSPAVLWTYTPAECCGSEQAADNFFQKHLYMRVFPMAPYPMNDHSIRPGDPQDSYYMKYGRMFRELNGFNWELEHLVVSDGLSVNTFTNGTHIVGVIAHADVTIAKVGLPANTSQHQYLLPGVSEDWTDLSSATVPIKDGCVMIRTTRRAP